jgi:hemoglobin
VVGTGASPFERFGGHTFFRALIADFYARLAGDPVLRPMYPGGDLGPAEERLRLFLEQYWGGPGTYSERRGHPRLRMRHASFPIDADAADRWLGHMRAALDGRALSVELDAELWGYLEATARGLTNTFPVAARPLPRT